MWRAPLNSVRRYVAKKEDFERMQRFIGHIATLRFNIVADSPGHPLKEMERIEREFGRANAIKGLKMAANDMVEELSRFSASATRQLDAELTEIGAMTLSEARASFSKTLKRVLKRREILSEEEFYLLRNAEDFLQSDDAAICQRLLAKFEIAQI